MPVRRHLPLQSSNRKMQLISGKGKSLETKTDFPISNSWTDSWRSVCLVLTPFAPPRTIHRFYYFLPIYIRKTLQSAANNGAVAEKRHKILSRIFTLLLPILFFFCSFWERLLLSRICLCQVEPSELSDSGGPESSHRTLGRNFPISSPKLICAPFWLQVAFPRPCVLLRAPLFWNLFPRA